MSEKQRLTRAELNQMAAELVMGESTCRCDPKRPSPRFSSKDGSCLLCGNKTLADYSRDAYQSKRLRDNMRADGYGYSTVAMSGKSIRWPFACTFHPGDHVSAADTEELAVLLAALRAVGAITGEIEVTE